MTYKMSGSHIGHTPVTAATEDTGAAPGMWQLKHVYPKTRASGSIARNWPTTSTVPTTGDTDTLYSSVKLRLPLDGNLTDVSNSPVSANDQATDTFPAGKFGQGLSVTNGYIEYSTGAFTQNTSSAAESTHTWAIEFWIKNTVSSYGGTTKKLILLDGSSQYYIGGKNGNLMFGTETIGAFTQNTWHHVLISTNIAVDLGGGTIFRSHFVWLDGTSKGNMGNQLNVPDRVRIGEGSSITQSFIVDDIRVTSRYRVAAGSSSSAYPVPTGAMPTSGGTASPVISMVSDGSSSYQEYAKVQLFNIPSGADGYKITIGGDEDGSQPVYSGVTFYIHNPTNNQQFTTSGMSSPNTRGNLRSGVNIIIKTQIASGVYYLLIYAPNDNGADAVTCQVQAIDSTNSTVGTASNTLTGMVIDEDG